MHVTRGGWSIVWGVLRVGMLLCCGLIIVLLFRCLFHLIRQLRRCGGFGSLYW